MANPDERNAVPDTIMIQPATVEKVSPSLLEHGRNLLIWLVGAALGTLVGATPLLLEKRGADPFDHLTSYLIWLAGMFLLTMFISIIRPDRVWRWAIAVELGLPAAVILSVMADPEAYQLLPLTIILSVLIAIPTAFGGAYLGKAVGQTYGS